MRRSPFLALLLLAGCAQILGLEERDLVEPNKLDGSMSMLDANIDAQAPDAGGSPGCAKYCQLAAANCTAQDKHELFQSDETCMAVCSKYSTDPSITGNTLACRLAQLDKLAAAGKGEASTYCAAASPGGGAAPGETISCNSDCEGFCALRAAVCLPTASDSDCVRKCNALDSDVDGYNADTAFGSGQDDIQCRLAHLSAAALYFSRGELSDRNAHCDHSGIRSKMQCDYPDGMNKPPPSCPAFCKVVAGACTGDSAVYENTQQCLAACAKIPVAGKASDLTTQGTLRCVREGAYDALELAQPRFCVDASPGSGRCGTGRCDSYCTYAAIACKAGFETKWGAGDVGKSKCLEECNTLPGRNSNDPYSVTLDLAKTGKNLQCRILHLTRALDTADTNTCNEALGVAGACL